MNALGAATLDTARITAVGLRRRRALTPLRAEMWEDWLHRSGLIEKYPEIPSGLRLGFRIGIPPILHTNVPPNSPSLLANAAPFQHSIAREFAAGRYLGPFSQSELERLIGPFQTSPISVIPKATNPSAFRLVQNFSFPRVSSASHTSINSHVNSDDFPCTWATFVAVCLLVWRLPPGSQACVRDIAEAYRTIPLHESQWPGTVVRLSPTTFALDTSAAFGSSGAPGRFGRVNGCALDIMRARGLGPMFSWVDDVVFVRVLLCSLAQYNAARVVWRQRILHWGGARQSGGRLWYGGDVLPDGRVEEFDEDMTFPIRDLSRESARSAADARFSYNTDDLDDISSQLGIPWQSDKSTPWASSFTFTGFLWDIDSRTVALTEKKRLKYLEAVRDWRAGSRARTLREVQSLYGKLLHACHVIPAGRAYLTHLEAALGIFGDNPWLPRTPPKGTVEDLAWWEEQLARVLTPRAIPSPLPLQDILAYSDASSGVGIAVVVGGEWRAWRLRAGWKTDGRDIAWAEAVGFELLVRMVLRRGEFPHGFIVYGDNRGVVEGWWNGRSRNRHVNAVFRRIHTLLDQHHTRVHTKYVASASNPADDPSRGVYPPSPQLPALALDPALAPFLFDAGPNTPADSDLWTAAHSKPARDAQRAARAAQRLDIRRRDEHRLIVTALDGDC